MAEDTDVGGIVASLKVNDSDWNAKFDAAEAKARELGALSPDVKINVDDAAALSKLAEVRTAVAAAGGQSSNASVSVTGATTAVAMEEALAAATAQADAAFDAATVSLNAYVDELQASADARAEAVLSSVGLGAAEREEAAATAAVAAANDAAANSFSNEKDAAFASTAATEASTAATNASSQALGTGVQRWQLIAVAIAALIPLLGPLVGYTVGVAGGFAGMGAAGILAVYGITQAIKNGTVAGDIYSAGLKSLKGNLDELSSTAALGVLSSFQTVVAMVDADMPHLNSEISVFSELFGGAATAAIQGVISAFYVLNPLFVQGGLYIQEIAQGFESWTSNGGLQKFAGYAQQELPQVAATLGQLATAAVHIVTATEPLGTVTLSVLRDIGAAIDAIPAPVLLAVAAAATTGFVAFKAWNAVLSLGNGVYQTVSQGIAFISTAMAEHTALTEEDIATSTIYTELLATQPGVLTAVAVGEDALAVSTEAAGTAFDFAMGPIGLVAAALGALGAVVAVGVTSTQQAAIATNNYTAALQEDNGAIGENVRATAAKALSDSGALTAANKLGISLGLVTDAALGNVTAQGKLNTEIGDAEQKAGLYAATGSELSASQQKLQDNTNKLSDAVFGNSSQVSKAVQSYRNQKAAVDAATGSQKDAEGQADKTTGALKSETTQTGLLQTAFDKANSKTLNAAQAQTALYAANNSLTDSFKSNGLAIDGSSAAAVSNQQAIQASVQAAQANALAIATQTGSTDAGTAAFGASKQALENQLAAQGDLTPAVQAYIDLVFTTPTDMATKFSADTAAAAAAVAGLQAQIDRVNSTPLRTATPAAGTNVQSGSHVGQAHGGAAGVLGFAGGGGFAGAVAGVGSAFSDSVKNVDLSNGEHVLTTSDVQKMGGQSGVYAFRAALQSGKNAPVAQASSSATQMQLTGNLYLDSGQLIGVITGIVQDASGKRKTAKGTGTQRAFGGK